MSRSRNTKCIGVKAALSETCLQDNRLDGFPSTSFLTVLICLECCDTNFVGDYVSRDVLFVPGVKVELVPAVFSRWLLGVPSAIKSY